MAVLASHTYTEVPNAWWSVDPGDVHVGLAEWRGTVCVAATETTPVQFEDRLMEACRATPKAVQSAEAVGGVALPDLVIIERFALRGALMAQQQGSEFFTSQMIGSTRFICRWHGKPLLIQTPDQHKIVLKRDPWRDWAQRRYVSYGHGPHAKSAELHGYFFIESVLRKQGAAALEAWKRTIRPAPPAR